jgi:hypothetical protein
MKGAATIGRPAVLIGTSIPSILTTGTPSGKLRMIARPNQIAEEKGGGGKSVREIDKEGSLLRG